MGISECLFDQTVFQRMERDHGEASAGLQYALRGGETAFEFAEFVVHVNAQRLESPCRGIDAVVRTADFGANHVGEVQGA